MRRVCKVHIKVKTSEDVEYIGSRFQESDIDDNDTAWVTVETNSADLKELTDYVTKRRLFYTISGEFIEYNEEEKEKLTYFEIIPTKPEKLDWSCEEYGTQFIFEKCEKCRAGAVQLNEVRFPVKRVLEYDFFRLPPALIVSKPLKEDIELLNAVGCEFREIVDTKTNKVDPRFYQLVIDTYLPPASGKISADWRDRCRTCKRDSVRFEGTTKYKLSDFSEGKDFYYSTESRYVKNCMKFRDHTVIMSKRIKELLAKHHALVYRQIYIEGLLEEPGRET